MEKKESVTQVCYTSVYVSCKRKDHLQCHLFCCLFTFQPRPRVRIETVFIPGRQRSISQCGFSGSGFSGSGISQSGISLRVVFLRVVFLSEWYFSEWYFSQNSISQGGISFRVLFYLALVILPANSKDDCGVSRNCTFGILPSAHCYPRLQLIPTYLSINNYQAS